MRYEIHPAANHHTQLVALDDLIGIPVGWSCWTQRGGETIVDGLYTNENLGTVGYTSVAAELVKRTTIELGSPPPANYQVINGDIVMPTFRSHGLTRGALTFIRLVYHHAGYTRTN